MAVTMVTTRRWPGMPCRDTFQTSPSFSETATRVSFQSRISLLKLQPTIRAALDTTHETWEALDSDVDYLTRSARLVQWYPGHIAKAERSLKEQLKLMDVVIEVRDARIPMATAHPEIDEWMGSTKKKILVLNREDMVSAADKQAWGEYFAIQGISVLFANGQRGTGTMKLARLAKSAADGALFPFDLKSFAVILTAADFVVLLGFGFLHCWGSGQRGTGTMKLARMVKSAADGVGSQLCH